MALSPTHRFGQIIGDVIEAALKSPLAEVAERQGLYLDCKCPRAARNGKKSVAWEDHKGNRHLLDYVLEDGGTEEKVGRPKAFVEIAYRSYTKHSKNKAQEIQGAVTPLFETYAYDHPFIGVVLAGVFTDASLVQLRSHGFGVLYIPLSSIVKAFKVVGIDASFDEQSKDSDVQQKVDAWNALSEEEQEKVGESIRCIHEQDLAGFITDMEKCLTRAVVSVFVLTLHGELRELASVEVAIAFIEGFDETKAAEQFVRYEVNIRYSNKDDVRATFESKTEAIKFLRTMA